MPTWKENITSFLATARKPLIVVLGPTASGKTDFSLELASTVLESGRGAEIVNADSRQLYRYLDVGTAKIIKDEMRGVPHHLFSALDPNQEVSIAWYKEQATEVISQIQERGNVPVLVGGSMLYISALIDGLEPRQPVDPEHRRMLEGEYDRDGGMSMYERLQKVDPDAAASIDPKNKRYLVRAMEILESTDAPVSSQRTKSDCPYDLLIFGMRWPRETLVDRINKRTPVLFKRGWIAEVESLIAQGFDATAPAMQSHGYREILEWISNGKNEKDLPAVLDIIGKNTRDYAKRQMTWWKHDPRIVWIDRA